MNDQELKEKLAYILYSDTKAFTTELNEILKLINQDQALRDIDIRIDELQNLRDLDWTVVNHKKIIDRIVELQAQKDKLIKGDEL